MTNFEKVKEFHGSCGTKDPTTPTWPPGERIRLRLELLDEEMDEIEEAAGEGDLAHLTKELCDLLYVAYGFLLVLGVDGDAAFAEVHRSNMSKFGPNGPERRPDGKILKGTNFSPADLSKVCAA